MNEISHGYGYGTVFLASQCGVGLVVHAVVAYLVMTCYQALPPQHRRMEPGLVWLNLIPVVNLVWIFFVFPGLADSYRSFFDARGTGEQHGDCGHALALALCMFTVLTIVPCFGFLASFVALVLLIVFLIKAFDLKKEVLEAGT